MTTFEPWPLILTVVSPAPPVVIQAMPASPTWTYWVPTFANLAVVIAAIIAYFAARVQVGGTIAATRMQLAAEKEARQHAEEAETERQKAAEERRSHAIRAQISLFLRRAARSAAAAGRAPTRQAFVNEALLQDFRRLNDRSYEVEVIEALEKSQADMLLRAVSMNEALLTYLVPFWDDREPSEWRRREVRLKCASALTRMTDAMEVIDYSPDLEDFRREIGAIKNLAFPYRKTPVEPLPSSVMPQDG
jgi:hypothetical protein